MAIFVFFAWMIEAADALGLIEIEAQDPASRAYRLAHHGLEVTKTELLGAPVEFLDAHQVRVRRVGQPARILTSHTDGSVTVQSGTEGPQELLQLGAGGGLLFCLNPKSGLEVQVVARTEDGGAYDVRLTIPPCSPGRPPPAAPPERPD